jgi:hypothetical protein
VNEAALPFQRSKSVRRTAYRGLIDQLELPICCLAATFSVSTIGGRFINFVIAVRRLIDGLIAQLRISAAVRRSIKGLIAQLRILPAVRRG